MIMLENENENEKKNKKKIKINQIKIFFFSHIVQIWKSLRYHHDDSRILFF